MENAAHLNPLKTKLQSLGALRPEAWQRIVQLCQHTQLKTGESLIRKEGTLAYITQGLLKEYDAQHRKSPAIINFLSINQCLLTRSFNQSYYLKASMPSLMYHWEVEALQQLHQEFRELKPIYEALCAEYDKQLLLRMRLLEMPIAERIAIFRDVFKPIVPYIKRKDIANYLHISYNYLLSVW